MKPREEAEKRFEDLEVVTVRLERREARLVAKGLGFV